MSFSPSGILQRAMETVWYEEVGFLSDIPTFSSSSYEFVEAHYQSLDFLCVKLLS